MYEGVYLEGCIYTSWMRLEALQHYASPVRSVPHHCHDSSSTPLPKHAVRPQRPKAVPQTAHPFYNTHPCARPVRKRTPYAPSTHTNTHIHRRSSSFFRPCVYSQRGRAASYRPCQPPTIASHKIHVEMNRAHVLLSFIVRRICQTSGSAARHL